MQNKKMSAESKRKNQQNDSIVISGIAGKYPACDSIDELAAKLFSKENCICQDHDRWDIAENEMPKTIGFLKDVRKFDAGFFSIPYQQIDYLDPICRLSLECAFEAVFDAGQNPHCLRGRNVGVFVGNSFSETSMEWFVKGYSDGDILKGCYREVIANRVSFALGLNGPSLVADTACSSSLTTTEIAYRAIRNGECESAIVLGTNLLLNPYIVLQFYRLGLVSETGTCRSFDDGANGYVRSEGIVAIFLQKAKDAKRVYGTIVHTKINCDGYKEFGITFPSRVLQRKLFDEVYSESGIDPARIAFVEAHATGTVAGDPEEASAITEVFCKNRTESLPIGSIKSNLGHAESASGLISVSKAVIIMHTGFIPPNLHFERPRQEIDGLFDGKLHVVTETIPLNGDFIAINSFGFGGANCHLVLKRFDKIKDKIDIKSIKSPRLVCLAGRNHEFIDSFTENFEKTKFDKEFIRLLQEIYKYPIDGYWMRNYLILDVDENGNNKILKRSETEMYFDAGPEYRNLTKFKLFLNNRKVSGLNFLIADFRNLKLFENFEKIFHEIFGTDSDLNQTLFQLAILEIFKVLNVSLAEICTHEIFGEFLVLYYDNVIDLHELFELLNTTFPSESCLTEKRKTNYTRLTKPVDVEDNDPVTITHTETGKSYKIRSVLNLLEILGEIFLSGCNMPVHKLFETIEWPVSCGTQFLSPLIRWNHEKQWKIIRFKDHEKLEFCQRMSRISINTTTYAYLMGHTIDGKTLMPASGYLVLVWETVALGAGLKFENCPIVFKRVRLIRATYLSKERTSIFKIKVCKVSGQFEIEENGSLVATGIAFIPQNRMRLLTENLEKPNFGTDIVTNDDIYLEYRLRGYEFDGDFKSILECNLNGTCSRIKWHGNYTVFLDGLLQTYFLRTDSALLYIPVYIDEIRIDTHLHREAIMNLSRDSIAAYFYEHLNVVRCGGIEVQGMEISAINRRTNYPNVTLESYRFFPHRFESETLQQSVTVVMQLIMENLGMQKVKVLEILSTSSCGKYPVSDLVVDTLNLIPLVRSEIDVFLNSAAVGCDFQFLNDEINVQNNRQLNNNDLNYTVIIANEALAKKVQLKSYQSALKPGGFLISREHESYTFEATRDFCFIEEHRCHETAEKLIVLRKPLPEHEDTDTIYFKIDNCYSDWLEELKMVLKTKKSHQKFCLYGDRGDDGANGLMGFANCLRKEPGFEDVKIVLVLDQCKGTQFDPKSDFYRTQLEKNLISNVYKNGCWGSYRRDRLAQPNENYRIQNPFHSCANTLVRGDLNSLDWIQGPLQSDFKHDDAEKSLVRIYYAALNFRDVLVLMGKITPNILFRNRLDENAVQGVEFAGITKHGQRVMGMMNSGAFSSVIAADRYYLWSVPDSWSLEDAATVPVAYLTAMYALIHEGKIKAGQTVLIHLGSGGVGQAAINVALHFGCRVFTTVGNEMKKEFILNEFPDINRNAIASSRDTLFEDMIMDQTDGKGVDIVLNSLADEKLEASIRCLKSGGKFLEIGKSDLINNSLLQMEMFTRNCSFHCISFGDPNGPLRTNTYNMLCEGLREGYVRPLKRLVYGHREIADAVRFMAQGKHIGKILIRLRNDETGEIEPEMSVLPRFFARSDRSVFVVVGGLGGFGLELADWLVTRGARRLIIVSRRGLKTGYQKRRVKTWKSYGVKVRISQANLGLSDECHQFLQETIEFGDIQAIFNVAVVLNDAIFENQTVANFDYSFESKVHISHHLDYWTRVLCPSLEHFVLFSSITSSLGNGGQTNYCLANSALEHIAEKRARDGYPSLAIQWGAVGDVGLAAKLNKDVHKFETSGILEQPIAHCLQVLDSLLTAYYGRVTIACSLAVAEKKAGDKGSGNVVETIAKILGIKDIKKVALHSTLANLGMDSMMIMEAKQILEQRFNLFFSQSDIRQLTMGKLIEIAAETDQTKPTDLNNQENKPDLNQDFMDMIYKRFGATESVAHEEVVQIECPKKSTSQVNDVLFFVPGIEGIATALDFLTSRVESLKNICLQLPYFGTRPMSTISDIVHAHLTNITKYSRSLDSFKLIGVSYGSVICLELALALEQHDPSVTKAGKIVLIDGSVNISKQKALIANNYPKLNEDLHVAVGEQFASRVCDPAIDTRTIQNELRDPNKTADDRIRFVQEHLAAGLMLSKDYVANIYREGYERIRDLLEFEPKVVRKLRSHVLLIVPETDEGKKQVQVDHGLETYLENVDRQLRICRLSGDHESLQENEQTVCEIMKFFSNDSFN